MERGSSPVRVALVLGLVSLALVAAAAPARAAFPGRNGLLVVEPVHAPGLVLVRADGAKPRRICSVASRCAGATDPVWSPDGSEIVLDAPAPASQGATGGLAPFVVYADGSCLACGVPALFPEGFASWDPRDDPGFLPDGQLAVSLDEYGGPPGWLGSVGVDGIGFQPFVASDAWQQTAWSAEGQLAAVRMVRGRPQVFLIDRAGGSVRQLTRNGAESPNWSPDGRRLAVVHAGWIEIIGRGAGRARRLARGRAPAWSPDGRKLAFVNAYGRLFVISARGGRPEPVGNVHAAHVDWQPLGRQPHARCPAPPGSTVIADSLGAVVTTRPAATQPLAVNPPTSLLGCLKADGRERLLESLPAGNEDNAAEVTAVALAGDYAAFANESSDPHYGGSMSTVTVFDLRTGATVAHRGGETVVCDDYNGYTCLSNLDQLILGPDAVTAAHTTITNCQLPSDCATTEQIVATDSSGTRTLDTATTNAAYGSATPSLTGLALTGDTLTWNHGGIERTAQLHG